MTKRKLKARYLPYYLVSCDVNVSHYGPYETVKSAYDGYKEMKVTNPNLKFDWIYMHFVGYVASIKELERKDKIDQL